MKTTPIRIGAPALVGTTSGPYLVGTVVRLEGRHRPEGPTAVIAPLYAPWKTVTLRASRLVSN